MKRAAFFDMDRTLLRVNTAPRYARWQYQRGEASVRDLLRVARWVAQYALGVIDPEEISRGAVATLAGVQESVFAREMEQWWAAELRGHVSKDARAAVQACRREGFVLVILTASTRYATASLARDLGIQHVLCSELEVEHGRFTGRCLRLCYGPGKVAAAERWAHRHGVDLARSVFYTDSVSDLPMLERVGQPRVVNPDFRLRWCALRRGWPVARWR